MTLPNAGTPPRRLMPLVIGAVGVVFGDIGTSPLYTVQQAFSKNYGLAPDPGNVLGVLSLVFWSLILVITVKYVAIIMRADNRGEGGILALMAVVQRSLPIASPLSYGLGMLGHLRYRLVLRRWRAHPGDLGAFGDRGPGRGGAVADRVRGARDDRGVGPAVLHPAPRRGRHGQAVRADHGVVVPRPSGPRASPQLIRNPGVLQALNPGWAVDFFLRHGVVAWLSLGAIVLAVTGGEALYADMGHFGRRPVRLAWLCLVLPCLLLELLRPGRADPGRPGRREQPVLPDGAGLGRCR